MRLCAAPTSLWRHTERGQPQLPLQLLSANASTTLCQLLTTANGRPIPPTTCRRASSSCFGGQLWLTHPQRHSIKYIRSQKRFKSTSQAPSKRSDRWELVVGLEIHAELNTSTKLFSRAQTSSPDATPNSHVAPFDAALPGSQPQFQTKTLIPAIRAALALGCDVQRSSRFDRKHYFYHDQPAGYQITQYYEPLAKNGQLVLYKHDGIAPEDGDAVRVSIRQVQMEQDTARTVAQSPSQVLIDYNRVSHPLIEIITMPEIHHASTAAAFVKKVQLLLRAVDAVSTGMEHGGLRVDVNVSVRDRQKLTCPGSTNEYYGMAGLGQRTEIKNLNSFKAIEDAINAERDRQVGLLEGGGVVEGESRNWNLRSGRSTKMRSKAGEVDYRYMPDPDLGEVLIAQSTIDHLRRTLPTLPDAMIRILTESEEYALSSTDAMTLVKLDDGERLDFYFDVVELLRQKVSHEQFVQAKGGRAASNWVLHGVGNLMTTQGSTWKRNTITADQMASLIALVMKKEVTGSAAKRILSIMFSGSRQSPNQIADDKGLILRPLSLQEYEILAEAVVTSNKAVVEAVKARGNKGKFMFLVGQMIKTGEEGSVEPQKAEAALRRIIGI